MLTSKLLSVIDNIVVDVFKIICCSEPTDSFMVNVNVAQLPAHSWGTRFYSRGPCPGWPPLAPPLRGGEGRGGRERKGEGKKGRERKGRRERKSLLRFEKKILVTAL